MKQSPRLPEEFEDLEAFVDDWALPTEYARHRKQLSSTLESIRSFYAAVMPRAPAIVAHLNAFPLERWPAPQAVLFNLAATFFEIAHVVELGWRTPDIKDPPSCRFEYRQ